MRIDVYATCYRIICLAHFVKGVMMDSMVAGATSGSPSVLEVLKLLADETRWHLVGALRRSDYQVGELVALLKQPQNLVSYHLGVLRQAGLVQIHRSDADARAVYYALDLAALQTSYRQVGASLQLPLDVPVQPLPPVTVLFLCTGNSARSQMAEGWLRHLSGGRVAARSAGTAPQTLHPLAIEVMAEAGVDVGSQHAKGLDALEGRRPDIVVTVCDRAREQCGTLLHTPTHLHWSIADPVRAGSSLEMQVAAFRHAREQLRLRVGALLVLLPTLTGTSS